jgi:hypothetical protein
MKRLVGDFTPESYEFMQQNAADLWDFTLCQRPEGDTYGIGDGKQCRKGRELDPNSSDPKERILARLTLRAEEKLGRGLTADEAATAQAAIERLVSEKAGGKKESGANLQEPETAAKYAEFYEKRLDLEHKAPRNVDPEVARGVLDNLREEMDSKEYSKLRTALEGKGSPTKEQREEAGWKGDERAVAVLKSLMDNNFQDVHGNDLSWRQGLQLDHKKAGSTGGKDTPDNWIWISTASNQVKGGMEAAAKKMKDATPDQKEEFIRQGLIEKLRANASMSRSEYEQAKGAGASRDAAKKDFERAMRDNLPVMDPQSRSERIRSASNQELEAMMKASVPEGKNPETNRSRSNRPILSGGGSERVRKAKGNAQEMRAILKTRWGDKLEDSDLRALGQVLKKSTGNTKPNEDKLKELFGNFPPATALPAAQIEKILDYAQ